MLPLSKKPDLVEVTDQVAGILRPHWEIEVDVTQAIGRRYRRQDEIGTPYCVTIDFDTLDDEAVTVRDRDTMAQDRGRDRATPQLPGRTPRDRALGGGEWLGGSFSRWRWSWCWFWAARAYVWFSGGSGEPSTEVTAPPITSASTTAPATTAPTTTSATTVTVATTEAPAAVETTDPVEPAVASAVLYRIDKEESSVSFEIDEILNGNPFRVVGVTTEVAGEVLIDFDEPAASQLGTIVINVRTLATDSGFRDRAIRGPILGSSRDENEFATFEPTDIEGLPDSVAMGDEVTLPHHGHVQPERRVPARDLRHRSDGGIR